MHISLLKTENSIAAPQSNCSSDGAAIMLVLTVAESVCENDYTLQLSDFY